MPQIRSEPYLSGKLIVSLLLLLSLIGAALRFYHLDSEMWIDEIMTLVESVRPPLAEILTRFPSGNDHLLYSVMAHLSVSGFGESAWSIRLPAALFGIASIPLLYAFGTQVTTRGEAILAATLMTVSYHHIWFSQNARGYTALLFWALLSSYFLLIALRTNRKAAYIGYAAAAALGMYSHLTMAFMIAGQAAFIILRLLGLGQAGWRLINWKLPLVGLVLVGALTLVLYAPIFSQVQTFLEERVPLTGIATASWAALAALQGMQTGFSAPWAVVLVGALLVVGAWSYFRRDWILCVLFLSPAPLTFLAAATLGHPMRPRFLFLLAGFAVLFAVRGAVVLGKWIARGAPASWNQRHLDHAMPILLVGTVVVMSALALPYGYRYPKQSYEAALRYIEQARTPSDIVFTLGDGVTLPYRHYFKKSWSSLDSVEQLRAARAGHDAIWVVFTFEKHMQSDFSDLLSEMRSTCQLAKKFPATVSDGEIIVQQCPGS
jgi:4-amino-4-deoxy-L-arabinose transferase-like glycosyltransferase